MKPWKKVSRRPVLMLFKLEWKWKQFEQNDDWKVEMHLIHFQSDERLALKSVLLWRKGGWKRRCLLLPRDSLWTMICCWWRLASPLLSPPSDHWQQTSRRRSCKCFSLSKNIVREDGHEGKLEQQSVSHRASLTLTFDEQEVVSVRTDKTRHWDIRMKIQRSHDYCCQMSFVSKWLNCWLLMSELVSSSPASFILISF